MNDQIFVSRREAAKALSISLRTLDNLIAGREIVTRRIGRRRLISTSELRRFANRDHAVNGGAENAQPKV